MTTEKREMPAELRVFLSKRMDEAIGDIGINGSFQSAFYVIHDGGRIVENLVDMAAVGKDEMAEMIRVACSEDGVRAAALIFDAYSLTVDEDQAGNIPASIANEKGTIETVLAFLYLRDQNFSRSVPYKKMPDGSYWFGDYGWKEVPEVGGRFSNPFVK